MSITLNGTVPAGSTIVILEANGEGGPGGILKFKFSAPAAGAYDLGFCIGPASNPCGLPTSYVVNVPGGQERLAVIEADIFRNNILVVSQGTSTDQPFAVTIE
ncbi:MAG TPA: hypothetical protein VHT28_16490 [Silvibacterium sp.]|nr:hypothetical protein [Silvibacterium sp.]